MPKQSRGLRGAAAASAAKRRASAAGGGGVQALIDHYERGAEPQEHRRCAFCDDSQEGMQRSDASGLKLRFVQCVDTDAEPASAYHFPGQSRDTPQPAVDAWSLKGRLAPELRRENDSCWSCQACANLNRRALNRMLTRLRQEPLRVAALRRVVANPHVMGQPADVAALGGMTVVPHHVVVVTTPAWEGMQRVAAVQTGGHFVINHPERDVIQMPAVIHYTALPPAPFSRVLCVRAPLLPPIRL